MRGRSLKIAAHTFKLKVDENETLRSLTIRAVSVLNENKFGVATVGIYSADGADDSSAPDAVITGVTVIPEAATVPQAASKPYKVKVTGTGGFDPSVVWSVDGSDRKAGTGVNSSGVLTVAADERP